MTLGNLLGPDCKVPEKRPWRFCDKKCPKCGGNMIENKKYIECGAASCNYIKKRKNYEEKF